MKTQVTLNAAKGQRLIDFALDEGKDHLLLVFDNGTFVYLPVESELMERGIEFEGRCLTEKFRPASDLIRIGIVLPEELDDLRREQAEERKMYAYLKAKYQ